MPVNLRKIKFWIMFFCIKLVFFTNTKLGMIRDAGHMVFVFTILTRPFNKSLVIENIYHLNT